MSVNIGIIGLVKSGKTTVFNTLTGAKAEAGLAPNIGVTKVPDPRLDAMADLLHPGKIVPTEVCFTDIGASAKGLADGKGISGEFLSHLSTMDALIAVVRAFRDESVPHAEGSIDLLRDIATINLELAVSDLFIIDRRLPRIEEALKGTKQPEQQHLLQERQLLLKIKASLEEDVPVCQMDLSHDESRTIINFQFLTAKPLLIMANIGEEQLAEAASLEEKINSRFSRLGCGAIALCGKLEMELAQLDEATADQCRNEYCLEQPGRDRAIRLSYQLIGLITFFTIASNELKAWPIPTGTDTVTAAGKIHSDMQRGFIRAEVIGYDDLVTCGSTAEARKRGLLRLEGKGYTIRDGDVITFLFNV